VGKISEALKDYPQIFEAYEAVKAAPTYAFDLETSTFSPHTGRIIGFSVSVDTVTEPAQCTYQCCPPTLEVPKSWYFQFYPEIAARSFSNDEAVVEFSECVPMLATLALFSDVFRDEDKECVMQNGKFDGKFMLHIDRPIKNQVIDTAVASWILDENRWKHGLKTIVKDFLGHDMVAYDELGTLFAPAIENYGADDARQTLRLWRYFAPQIEAERLTKVFRELECSIPLILAQMEHTGCNIDIPYLRSLHNEVHQEKLAAEAEIYRLAGEQFSIGSPAQLNYIFFEKMGWKPRGKLKKTVHGYSVAKDVLERYEKDKPLAAAILRWKELDKLEGTYFGNLEAAAKKIDGRVRSRFNQIAPPSKKDAGSGGTATGRLSASADDDLGGVNLQTIPSRSETGRKLRGAFTAGEDNTLITYDFSQIELRFMAHMSCDKTLLEAYRKWDCVECGGSGETSEPLHACPVCSAPEGHRRAEEWCAQCSAADVPEDAPKHGFCLGLDIHQITADACNVARYMGKVVNFALLYGMGPKGLARDIKCSLKVAQQIYDAYFAKYPGIVVHNRNVQAQVVKYGYVRTILGRKRRFPHKQGRQLNLWDREWRQAANAVIQGCKALSSKVLTTLGPVRLSELDPNTHELITYSGTTQDYVVHRTGEKQVYWVETTFGAAKTTKDHRFLTYKNGDLEVVQLEQLSPKDCVVGHLSPEKGKRVADPRDVLLAEFIGILCGDGWYNHPTTFTIGVGEPREGAWSQYVEQRIESLWPGVGISHAERGGGKGRCWTLRVGSKAPREELLARGLGMKKGRDKEIPAWIFVAPDEVKAAALRGLYDTDGGLTGGRLQFTSVSEHLALGFVDLCLALGIQASVRKYREAFRVDVVAGSVERFFSVVVPFNAHKVTTKRTSQKKWAPSDLVATVGEFVKSSPEWSSRRTEERALVCTSEGTWKSRVSSYEVHAVFTRNERAHVERLCMGSGTVDACLKFLSRLEPSPERDNLMDLVNLPWARIRNIEDLGVQETGDIEIFSDDHCYVSSGLVMHNSAADLMKCAMRNTQRRLVREELDDCTKFLLQVHDEMTLETPLTEAERVDSLVQYEMEHCFPLRVPVIASGGRALNWLEAK